MRRTLSKTAPLILNLNYVQSSHFCNASKLLAFHSRAFSYVASSANDKQLRSQTWHRPVTASSSTTVLKSSFQAFVTHLSSPPLSSASFSSESLAQLLSYIASTHPRTKRATHAMYAWRASSSSASSGPPDSGSSDGGESGAGEHLSRLLELSKCEDVILVVFRWYGGVQMGGQRWKCISIVAREALELGGFIKTKKDRDDLYSKSNVQKRTRKK